MEIDEVLMYIWLFVVFLWVIYGLFGVVYTSFGTNNTKIDKKLKKNLKGLVWEDIYESNKL